MADYGNWKVPDLKAELKRRGIPQTGLRLKQQIIDRLLEADAAGQQEQQPEAEQPEAAPEPPAEKRAEESQPEPEPAPESEIQAEAQPPAPPQDASADNAPQVEAPAKPSEGTAQPPPDVPPESERVSEKPAPEPEPKPEPAPTEQPAQEPVAPPQPAAQDGTTSRASAAETPTPAVDGEPTPLPSERVASEESTDESRKRKRRSQSPPPSPRTAAQKKAKAEHGEPRVVLDDEAAPERKSLPAGETPAVPQDTEVVMSTSEPADERPRSPREERDEGADKAAEAQRHAEERRDEEQTAKADEGHPARRPTGDARFKELFPSTNGEQLRQQQQESTSQVEPEDRVVEPSFHPATTSVYIRDFMRPLQPAALKTHLASLATPRGASPDPSVITTFFLDSIKTHCFATFSNVSAASRVRSALHGTTWPEERTRKPLWVDYIPEDKVGQFIDTEQNAGNGGRGAPRWEVTYDETDDGVTATLQEAGPNNRARPGLNNRDTGMPVPTGPRADRDPPPPAPPRNDVPGHGFKPLDDRFMSTTAKPKLYYLPVSRDISDKRLDRFDDLARKGPVDRRGGDEMRKYMFEDTDFFVDRGPEFGRRGPRGGRGGGRGGGGYADFGGSWRGRR